jgi:RNA polymerase-binding protein DksA
MTARGAASAGRTRRTDAVAGAASADGVKPEPTTASRRAKAPAAGHAGSAPSTSRSSATTTPGKPSKASKSTPSQSTKPAKPAKAANAAKPAAKASTTAARAQAGQKAAAAPKTAAAPKAPPAPRAHAAKADKGGRTATVPAQKQGRSQPGASSQASTAASAASRLAVREDESPWTAAELAAVRGALEAEIHRLRSEIVDAESMISDLLRDAGEGAGDDQADAGTKTFEREHEMSLAANSRDMLEQTSRALARIDAGTYGVCESCGNPIGKRRLQAFPRATLCMTCKQREERR